MCWREATLAERPWRRARPRMCAVDVDVHVEEVSLRTHGAAKEECETRLGSADRVARWISIGRPARR
jgi:hypothetical protein